MNKIRNRLLKIKAFVYKNPKRFYKYWMAILIVLFVFSTWKEIYYPSKYFESTQIPQIQKQSDEEIAAIKKEEKSKEMKSKAILKELEYLGKKRENKILTKEDSVRVEYLMNKYNEINHEGF
ncbi:hypothetical protein [Bergeyella sp. RCAD1439]|uniref:hypothetical protein n=1 Tax=Bergeyella anatis TaxID=3113737 RepID=UPI002E194062|nr:hypothetical protein [Bergeyella sp. RCAD1439]